MNVYGRSWRYLRLVQFTQSTRQRTYTSTSSLRLCCVWLGVSVSLLMWLIRNYSYDHQVNVMAYDYSGYGDSGGKVSERACYADIEAAFQYLIRVKKASPSKIIL